MAQQPLVGQSLIIEAHDDTQTHHTRQVSSGRLISPPRCLYLTTQHLQETDILTPGWIQTPSPSKQETAGPRLRPRGHCHRGFIY